MGAWGSGMFENDSVSMALEQLLNVEPVMWAEEVFQASQETEYLDVDEGAEVLIAAVFIDAVCNGYRYEEFHEEFHELVEEYECNDLRALRPSALAAMHVLISDISEMNGLWEDSGIYDEWRKDIDLLIERLRRMRR